MRLLNYYMPRLKKQLILYPVISVFLYMLIFFTLRWDGAPFIALIVYNIIYMMLFFGALIFASRNGMEIDTMLPVDWRRKALFLLVYTFIVVPLLVVVPIAACYMLTRQWLVVSPLLKEAYAAVSTLISGRYITCTVIGNMLPMAVCLYCVTSIRHNRIILSIVWTIVTCMLQSFIGGIYGAFIAFKQGFSDGYNGVELSSDEIASRLLNEIGLLITPMEIFFAICTIFVIVITCRAIKGRQI